MSTTPQKAYDIVATIGISRRDWDLYREEIAKIESAGSGGYSAVGGTNSHYDGRYQLGSAAKQDGARIAGTNNPGHTPAARESFRNSPEQQEILFAGYTVANYNYIKGANSTFKNSGVEKQLEILGYAHNQGWSGANDYLKTGRVGADGFGTKGTEYSTAIATALQAQGRTASGSTERAVNQSESTLFSSNSSSSPLSVSDPAEYPTREYGNTDKYSDQILKDKLQAGSDRIEELERQTFLTDEDKEEQQKIISERANIIEELVKRQNSDCVSHQTQGKSWRFKDTPKCEQFAASTTYQNAVKEFEEKFTLPNPCGSGELSRINTALHKFFTALKGMKKYGDLYINGAINKTRKLTRLLRNAGNIIGSAMKTLMQKARDWLLRKIRNGIKDLIHMLFPTIAKSIKESIIGKIIDTVLCKFKEVMANLPNIILDFLFELIGKVVNIPFCAAQQWSNGLLNNLVSQIDTAIGPILDEINDVLSGVGKIAGSVFEAVDFILGFESFLCEKPNCPEITEFEAGPWGGPSAAQIKAFSGFAAIPSVGEANDAIGEAIGNIPIFGETLGEGVGSNVPIPPSITKCDSSAYRCGPPTIEIFGGGGVGAAANAVVDGFGKLIGVDIVNRGGGYKTPPFVTIVDSCGNGNYASGYSVLNSSGEVVKVIVVNSGFGYLNAPNGLNEFGEELFTTPGSGDGNVSNNVRDYVVCLDEIQVIGTGIGYTPEDEIRMVPDIPNLSASVQMTETGQIIGISILDKPCNLTTIPEIRINSRTGEGFSARVITSVQETSSFDSEDSFRSGTLVTVIDCIR